MSSQKFWKFSFVNIYLCLLMNSYEVLCKLQPTFPHNIRHRNKGSNTNGKYDFEPFATPPKCAQGKSYCEHYENYPIELVNFKIQESDEDFDYMFTEKMTTDIKISVKDSFNEARACRSKSYDIYPQIAMGMDDQWYHIVQTPKYNQSVAIELCMKENDACVNLLSVGFSYKTTCKNKYYTTRLLSIENEDIKPKLFRFPLCCVCFVDRQDNFF